MLAAIFHYSFIYFTKTYSAYYVSGNFPGILPLIQITTIWVALYFHPSYILGNWGPERSRMTPKVTQFTSSWTLIQTQHSGYFAPALNHYPMLQWLLWAMTLTVIRIPQTGSPSRKLGEKTKQNTHYEHESPRQRLEAHCSRHWVAAFPYRHNLFIGKLTRRYFCHRLPSPNLGNCILKIPIPAPEEAEQRKEVPTPLENIPAG